MAGKVKNCPHCGKLFADYGAHMCRDCEDKMREKEAEVVNYVRDHPKAKVLEITEATGCSEQLIKIKAGKESRADIKNIVEIFRAKIVDISPENVVVELTGQQSKIDGFIDMFADYEIIEIARTGAIALSRGPVPVKEM